MNCLPVVAGGGGVWLGVEERLQGVILVPGTGMLSQWTLVSGFLCAGKSRDKETVKIQVSCSKVVDSQRILGKAVDRAGQ